MVQGKVMCRRVMDRAVLFCSVKFGSGKEMKRLARQW